MSTYDVATTPREGRRPPMLRLQVLAHRRRLDRLLAEGHDPATDLRLAMRAGQLVDPPARARLATALRDAVCSLDDSSLAQYLRPEIPVAASVRTCAWEIEDLAQALVGPDPRVRGVAIVRGLLADGAGPLYDSGQAGRLRATVAAARSAL